MSVLSGGLEAFTQMQEQILLWPTDLQGATAKLKTFVLTAKNYFYMVIVKRKMYFHLRKRCPSHAKSLFTAVFNLMSWKVKGARE